MFTQLHICKHTCSYIHAYIHTISEWVCICVCVCMFAWYDQHLGAVWLICFPTFYQQLFLRTYIHAYIETHMRVHIYYIGIYNFYQPFCQHYTLYFINLFAYNSLNSLYAYIGVCMCVFSLMLLCFSCLHMFHCLIWLHCVPVHP